LDIRVIHMRHMNVYKNEIDVMFMYIALERAMLVFVAQSLFIRH